jgi:hypothetical protein
VYETTSVGHVSGRQRSGEENARYRLELEEKRYLTNVEGHDSIAVTPTCFPSLTTHLDRNWT